jgi:hypothetical protein
VNLKIALLRLSDMRGRQNNLEKEMVSHILCKPGDTSISTIEVPKRETRKRQAKRIYEELIFKTSLFGLNGPK